MGFFSDFVESGTRTLQTYTKSVERYKNVVGKAKATMDVAEKELKGIGEELSGLDEQVQDLVIESVLHLPGRKTRQFLPPDERFIGARNKLTKIKSDMRKTDELLDLQIPRGEEIMGDAEKEVFALSLMLDNMRQCRIIKMATSQLSMFMDTPRVEGQDYLQLHSPFKHIYIEPVGDPVTVNIRQATKETRAACRSATTWQIPEYLDKETKTLHNNVPIKGMMIVCAPGSEADKLMKDPLGLGDKPHRIVQVTIFIPLPNIPENTYVGTFVVDKQGVLTEATTAPAFMQSNVTTVLHILNYLTSPAVEMVETKINEALQAARVRRGKEPLPGWYEIQYKKSAKPTKQAAEGAEPTSHHSFRYDVRGHFMRVKKGRLAGRVFWIPPHQRGLANALYKPKTYRTATAMPEQPTLYNG